MITRDVRRSVQSSLGAKDRYVTIQQATEARGSAGGIIPTWSIFVGVWAARRDLSGRELVAAQQIQAESTTEFRINYRTGITTKMRLIDGSQTFDILNASDQDGRKIEYVLLCREVV